MSAVERRVPRVVVVSDGEEHYGAERALTSLATRLSSDYELIAVVGDGAARETKEQLALAVAELRTVRGLRYRCTPSGFLRLLRLLRALRPDLVHVHCTDQSGGLAPILAAWLLRQRVIATVHLISPGRSGWKHRLSVMVLRRTRLTIGISSSIGDFLARNRIGSTVIRGGIAPLPLRRDTRTALRLSADAFVVGGIGRLHAQKGWDVLCRAATTVAERIPSVEFIVIGSGPERESLEGLAECGMVRFAGYREEAASFLPAFDVLAIPSRWEGLGRVAVEAMLAGVPVVASRVGGLPEAVGQCALLVPPNEPELLADALVTVATDAETRTRLLECGVRRAREMFAMTLELDLVRDAYRAALE